MWSKSYSKKLTGFNAEQIWKVWTDINKWHLWQEDIEFAKLQDDFEVGSIFVLKIKNGPKVNIKLVAVEPNKLFTDLSEFPLAKMYGAHEIIDHGNEIELKITISLTGPLSFVWRKLVVAKIVEGLPKQIDSLIARVQAVG